MAQAHRPPETDRLDAKPVAPLLRGQTQSGRDYIVAEYNENVGGHRNPMRSIITRDFGYLFNPWSNGRRVMPTATKGTITYSRMQALAQTDQKIAARVRLIDHRVLEELYYYASDPDALNNLIHDPKYRAERERLTKLLEAWMAKTGDPMLEVFRNRHDPKVREEYMARMEKEAAERKGKKAKAAKKAVVNH